VVAVGAPALALAAMAAVWISLRAAADDTAGPVEVEPNDDVADARRLIADIPVQGWLGKRRSIGASDRDIYRLPGQSRRTVTAELSGVPGLDVVLEVVDLAGHRQALADEARVGKGERLTAVLPPGDAYLIVREVRIEGQPAGENLADAYRLVARW
jgi:hypothetical protein